MRDALIHFLDRIKDYEHESGHSMHEDERESSEIVDIHLEAFPELKNYVFISHVSGISWTDSDVDAAYFMGVMNVGSFDDLNREVKRLIDMNLKPFEAVAKVRGK